MIVIQNHSGQQVRVPIAQLYDTVLEACQEDPATVKEIDRKRANVYADKVMQGRTIYTGGYRIWKE